MTSNRTLTLGALLGAFLVAASWGCNGGKSSSAATPTPTPNANPVVVSPADQSTLPDAAVGTPYSQTFTITSGGTSPFGFTATGVPAGMTFTQTGTLNATLQGTPTTVGAGVFEFKVTDSTNAQTVLDYALTVDGAGFALAMTPTTAPNGTLGQPYSFAFQVHGGTAPFNFTKSTGSLPSGLTLGPGGASGQAVISGTVGSQGTYPFTIQVTDSSNPAKKGTQNYSITVN